ncbi:hypothetical protein H1Q59_06905 [Holosporaceae bacterium 'Namur']|nr:hypothetical protein [Holosporaceae bacterium 'Namur']
MKNNKQIAIEEGMKEIADKVSSLPSLQNEALSDVIKEMYMGKPLFGKEGLLTKLAKELTELALEGEMEAHRGSKRKAQIFPR